jgi:hypothetical protein
VRDHRPVADIEDLGTVIDESTMLEAEVIESDRTFRLRLAVLAHPAPGQQDQPQVTFVFAPLSRIACRVYEVEDFADPSPAQPWRMESRQTGATLCLSDAADLNDWFHRFRGDLYGQPYPMFDRPDPDWLADASCIRTWTESAGRTIDLGFGRTPDAPRYLMDLRAWFENVTAFDRDGQQLDLAEVVATVRAWWSDFKAGRTHGQYGYVPAGE